MRKGCFAVIVILVAVSLVPGVLRLVHASAVTEGEMYVVESGDTLWSIARMHAPNTMDIRDYIYRVRRINSLTHTAMIHPGQELYLPQFSSARR